MKKVLSIIATSFCFMLLFFIVACNGNEGGLNPPSNNYIRPSNVTLDESFVPTSNTLVAYFSKTNTTKSVAEKIQELTNANLFKIERKESYPTDYTTTTEVAKEEKEENERPELSVYLPDEVMAQYDTIFLGFPIWWHTAPMAVLSFLNYYDFNGKTIYTFCTSGGSAISESTADVLSNAKGATVIEGRKFSSDSDQAIEAWINSLDLTEKSEAFSPAQDNRPGKENTNTLVVYFSMPETTDPNNMTTEEANSTVIIDGIVLGNTQYMAYVIQDTSGADIFRIIPEVPYPTDHRTLVDLASEEKAQNARPTIQDTIKNLSEYETIFIGYPNWWGDMPMILYTFFDTYDFSGKTIIPFNTHGGSGFSSTISTIRRIEPYANVREGLSISRNNIQEAEQQIVTWVTGLGISFVKPEQTAPSTPDNGDGEEAKHILIVYFSWSGNTSTVARSIERITGGDVVEIEAAIPYTGSYNDIAYGRAKEEADTNARPEVALTTYDKIDISKYDTVFVGFPIWWHTAPMIIGTFLEHYTWSAEMDIYPFFQGASNSTQSYYDNSMAFVRDSAKGATVHDGLYAAASNISALENYLRANGFMK